MSEKLITRLVEATNVSYTVINRDTNEVSTKVKAVAGTYTDPEDKTLIKSLSKSLSPSEMLVRITGLSDTSEMYGMTIAQFMASATLLDRNTRRVMPRACLDASAHEDPQPVQTEQQPKETKKKRSRKS